MAGQRKFSEPNATGSRINRRNLVAGSAAGLAAQSVMRSSEARLQTPESGSAAVVSAHSLATQAGIEILEAGGTAADAAVAVAAVLSVVEPYFSSALGGGTWGIYFDAQPGEITAMDGVGPVGSLATLEDYRERADGLGIHQANVPGSWDGWMLWLDNYGLLDLNVLLAPAIGLARDGYPVSSEMAFSLEFLQNDFIDFPDTAATYDVNGSVPVAGDTQQLPDMADTFQSLGDAYEQADGDRTSKIQAARDYFYRGPIAEAIVAFSEQTGGYFTLDDFANFEASIVNPISINYRGLDVYQNPPNSQGIAMLMALNILKGFDLTQVEADSADTIHIQVEAIKLAFADRYAYVGDPAVVDVPVETLLSDEHAREQLGRIDLANAMDWPISSDLQSRKASHTSTFHIVDQMGNAAAVTTSIGYQFLVVGNTGIHINARNRFMSLDEDDPNVFAPGKKVRHTSCPYMVLQNGRPVILGGNTGVDTQPQAQIQQFMNIVDFGFGAQEAVDQPRFVSTAFPTSTYPYDVGNTLQMEEGFPEDTISALQDRGHLIAIGEGLFGSAHSIIINADEGQLDVGAESRQDVSSGVVIPGS